MKIRSQLAWMMAAVVAPLVLLAIGFTFALADVQHELQMQRVLERVRALRLALDTEINATTRLLRILAHRPSLRGVAPPVPSELHALLQSYLSEQPGWAALMVVEPDGRELARLDRPSPRPAPPLDERTRQQVRQTRSPAISGLVTSGDDREPVTFIAVPVLGSEGVTLIVAVAIGHRDWLALLGSHPMGEGATLGLVDQDGHIVARTLNPERSVGQPASPDFLRHVNGEPDASFVNVGMEGQRFYSAYSRLGSAPWTLGTGVPADAAEAALRTQQRLLAVGVLLATLIASGVAVLLRRRILAALGSLADVSRLRDDRAAEDSLPLAIGEAEQVRQLLGDTLRAEAAARAEAEAARAQAEVANRAKDDFLAMMAHELRNPLSAMSTAVTLLEVAHAPADTQQRARAVLGRQVRQLTRLVDDLLDATRAARGNLVLTLESLDLARLVRDVMQTFDTSGRLRHLQVETALEPAPVLGDALRLEQLVGNLLDNAAKFTAAGKRLCVTLRTEGEEAVLSVTDDGAGIDAALLPRLFEPYTQADPGFDRSRGGLGLGLHLVRRLAELHGGSVQAHSEGLGRGARFTVRLPLSTQPPAAPAQLQSGALPPLRVALVEDNPDGREAVATLLRMAGHETLCAADGHAGLALLRQAAPEVALVDLGLPGMDGLTLVRTLRQDPSAPAANTLVVALTAYGDDSMREQARHAGFDGFLQKPFDLREFENTVVEARMRRRVSHGGQP